MKKLKFLIIGALAGLTIASLTAVISVNAMKSVETQAYSYLDTLPTTIDLNDSTDSDIRSYYSSLNSKTNSKRTGTALLGELKTILKTNQVYFSYDDSSLWDLYEITDRDWSRSPASSISGYNSSTKKITGYSYGSTDPYVHALYVNRGVTNQTVAHADHTQTNWGINQEHIWAKSHGFNGSGSGGARGDPMHLWAANGYANNIHSNFFFGNVDKTQSYTDCGSKYSMVSGNYKGISKTMGSGTVFEPQDSDKGDIARAIFYMVARYNTYGGSDTISADNPNLELVQRSTDTNSSSYTSDSSTTGKMGIMSDLLEWNKQDKPDAYEIHRNNILFKNYTMNRNPFIDFPEWADYIWGSKSGSSYATPSSDTINDWSSGSTISVTSVSVSPTSKTLTVGDTQQLTATVSPSNATNKAVSYASSNSNVATVSSSGLVTAVGTGSATITITTDDGGKTATCSITVTASSATVSSVTVSPSTLSLDLNGETTGTLSATVTGTNNPSQAVTWSSDDESVAVVSSSGAVTAIGTGQTVVVATSVIDGTKRGSCTVTVTSTIPASGSVTIEYTDNFDPALPTTSSNYNTSPTLHTDTTSNIKFKERAIYKGTSSSSNYIMFYGAGSPYIFNTESLGSISEIEVTYSSGVSESAQIGVYFSDSQLTSYKDADQQQIGGKSQTDTFTNSTLGCGYFQISTGTAKNCQITKIVIKYEDPSQMEPTVTSVTVEPLTLSLDLNGTNTGTLSATVRGINSPDTSVVWESSNTSIATVSSSGVVTAISRGSAVITATSAVDGSKEGRCDVTVYDSSIVEPIPTNYTLTTGSPYINGVAYKMFYYFEAKTSNYYFKGSMSGYYGATSSSPDSAVDIYFEQSGNGQNIYFWDGTSKNYLSVVLNGTYINFTYSTAQPTTKWTYSTDFNCMVYVMNSVVYTFGSYSGSKYTTFSAVSLTEYPDDYKVEFVTSNTTGVEAFASVFMNNITCDANGINTPSFASDITWTSFANAYTHLNDENKEALLSTAGSLGGSAAQQAMHRYDYMIGKYGSNVYNDFIGRNPTPLTKVGFSLFNEVSQTSMTAIIVILTLVGVTSIGVIVTLKKRKEN